MIGNLIEEGKKATDTKAVATFEDIEISSQFECGSGIGIRKLDNSSYAVRIPCDPLNRRERGDYGWYFCVRIVNKSAAAKKITIIFFRDELVQSDDWTESGNVPLFSSRDFVEWKRIDSNSFSIRVAREEAIWNRVLRRFGLDNKQIHEGAKDYFVQLCLRGSSTVFCCNSIPKPFSQYEAWIESLAVNHREFVSVSKIGRSLLGNTIYLTTIGSPQLMAGAGAERMLITSGTHPAEVDTSVTEAIAEFLVSEEVDAKTVRNSLLTDIVCQLNPDGFVLGTNGCNAAGVNQFWDFRPYDKKFSPETVALWKWIEKHPPSVWLDFHGFVHNTAKEHGPYIKPVIDYHGKHTRDLVRILNHAMVERSKEPAVFGSGTNLPTTLSYLITREWNTIAYPKYHVVLKHGVEKSKQLGQDVWYGIATTYLRARGIGRTDADSFEPLVAVLRRLNWLYEWYLRLYVNPFITRIRRILWNRKR